MSGSIIRLGHVRLDSSGTVRDTGVVNTNQQVATVLDPITSAAVIAYRMGFWIGRNIAGQNPRIRGAFAYAAGGSPGRPGDVIAYTHELTPGNIMTSWTEGGLYFANFGSPVVYSSGHYALAIGSTAGDTAFSMIEAQDNPAAVNRNLYRKAISGNTPTNPLEGAGTYEGVPNFWVEGEANVAPNTPGAVTVIGGPGNRRPVLRSAFSDANEVLNNGVEWDQITSSDHRISWGGVLRWSDTFSATSTEKSLAKSERQIGISVPFYTTITYQVRHMDRQGAWSPYRTATFVVAHANNAPATPTNIGGGQVQGTRTVTLTSSFSDPDEILPDGQAYDYLSAIQIIVRRVSDGVDVYNTGITSVTTAERDSGTTSRTFTLPAWDVDYRYYIRHFDRAGTSSLYASTVFKAVSGASVDKPTSPSGRITTPANPGTVSAVYRNSAGLNCDYWQIGLFNSSNQLVDESPVFGPTSIAPDGTLSASWAATTFGTLANGTEYKIGVKARSTNGQWSKYSDLQTITTNAAPRVPVPYSPADNYASNTLNYLEVTATDPDQPGSQLTVTLEVATPAEVSLGTVAMDPHPTIANRFRRIPTSLISGYQTFKWRTRASDGYLTSDWSPWRTYVYAALPSVTITSPSGPTITTMSPTITWDAPAQESWVVQLFREDGEAVYAASGSGGTTKQHTIQAQNVGGTGGGWLPGERWNNGETFVAQVSVVASGLLGSSAPLTLTLAYAAPEPLVVTIEAMSLPGVAGTQYHRLEHSQTSYEQGQFLAYHYYRTELAGPEGPEIPATRMQLARNGNAAETWLEDFDVTAGVWYRYEAFQEVQQGVDVITSEPVSAVMMCSWDGVLLHMPFDPHNTYVYLRVGAPGASYEPSFAWDRDIQPVSTIAGRKPIGFSGPEQSHTLTGTFGLYTDDSLTADERLAALYRIWNWQGMWASPDGRPHIICAREGRGGPAGRLYGQLVDVDETLSTGDAYAVDLEFREFYHALGEEEL